LSSVRPPTVGPHPIYDQWSTVFRRLTAFHPRHAYQHRSAYPSRHVDPGLTAFHQSSSEFPASLIKADLGEPLVKVVLSTN
jgi:hypothetical protein